MIVMMIVMMLTLILMTLLMIIVVLLEARPTLGNDAATVSLASLLLARSTRASHSLCGLVCPDPVAPLQIHWLERRPAAPALSLPARASYRSISTTAGQEWQPSPSQRLHAKRKALSQQLTSGPRLQSTDRRLLQQMTHQGLPLSASSGAPWMGTRTRGSSSWNITLATPRGPGMQLQKSVGPATA